MNKWYFIYAYDHKYEGLYGLEDWKLLYTTKNCAIEEAQLLSEKIITSNGIDVFFHKYGFNYDEALERDVAFEIWTIQENAPIADLMVSHDSPGQIINKWCAKEIAQK